MLKQYTILLLFCLCAAHSAATSLSLRDCMEYAIAHSAKMEIQRANNDDARIARREASFTNQQTMLSTSCGRRPGSRIREQRAI